MKIKNEDYQIRSIVYHKGTDEMVFGHFVCHCLIEFQHRTTKQEKEKRYGHWFLFDDNESTPLLPGEAINEEDVKTGCTMLFYQKSKYNINTMVGKKKSFKKIIRMWIIFFLRN